MQLRELGKTVADPKYPFDAQVRAPKSGDPRLVGDHGIGVGFLFRLFLRLEAADHFLGVLPAEDADPPLLQCPVQAPRGGDGILSGRRIACNTFGRAKDRLLGLRARLLRLMQMHHRLLRQERRLESCPNGLEPLGEARRDGVRVQPQPCGELLRRLRRRRLPLPGSLGIGPAPPDLGGLRGARGLHPGEAHSALGAARMAVADNVVAAHRRLEGLGRLLVERGTVRGPQPVTLGARYDDLLVGHDGRHEPFAFQLGVGARQLLLRLVKPVRRRGDVILCRLQRPLRLAQFGGGRKPRIRQVTPAGRKSGRAAARLRLALFQIAGQCRGIVRQSVKRAERIGQRLGALRHFLCLAEFGARILERLLRLIQGSGRLANILRRLTDPVAHVPRQDHLGRFRALPGKRGGKAAGLCSRIVPFLLSSAEIGIGEAGAGDERLAVVEPGIFEPREHFADGDAFGVRHELGKQFVGLRDRGIGLRFRFLRLRGPIHRHTHARHCVPGQVGAVGRARERRPRLVDAAGKLAAMIGGFPQGKLAPGIVADRGGVAAISVRDLDRLPQGVEPPWVQPRLGQRRVDLPQPVAPFGENRRPPARLVERLHLFLCLFQQIREARESRRPGVEQLAQVALGARDLLPALAEHRVVEGKARAICVPIEAVE